MNTAAKRETSAKPHQGHQPSATLLHPGIGPTNSNPVTVLAAWLYDFRTGPGQSGKEWDAETGLDYFGARYFSSAQGRFTSPDWSAAPQPVPYADLSNPQSLNLYNYMRNNPLSGSDPDGHCDWNCWSQFGSGFADTTYRPIVQAVSHPLDTGAALLSAASHPLDTAVAIRNAVVATGTAALSGDPTALGQVTGTVVSAIATAGVGKAATGLVQGAEVSEAAASATLFRAVGSAEAESIGAKSAFTAAPNGTQFKGFFFNQSDAQKFRRKNDADDRRHAHGGARGGSDRSHQCFSCSHRCY
jgi:RHS repeat-associated protein